MKSFGACSAIVMAPGCLQLFLVGILRVGPAVGAGATFRSEPQPVTVREAMGAVLVTAESFRLLTDLTEPRLAGCQSTRPDLPDARIQPETKSGAVQVSRAESGELVLSATAAPLSVIRDRAEMFTCAAAADFTIRVAP